MSAESAERPLVLIIDESEFFDADVLKNALAEASEVITVSAPEQFKKAAEEAYERQYARGLRPHFMILGPAGLAAVVAALGSTPQKDDVTLSRVDPVPPVPFSIGYDRRNDDQDTIWTGRKRSRRR